MSLVLRAQAFGPLARVDWTIPPGVSAIVGPNRVGKSTLLALPEFIRVTIARGLNEAVKQMFGGTAYFRNLTAPASVSPGVGLSAHDFGWDIEITMQAGAIAPHCAEQLRQQGSVILSRAFGAAGGNIDGQTVKISDNVIPSMGIEAVRSFAASADESGTPPVHNVVTAEYSKLIGDLPALARAFVAGGWLAAVAASFLSYQTYHYRIPHLLRYGSIQSADATLERTGENVFPLLRNWRDNSETEARFEFVLSTLREAFPHVRKVDFEQAGETVTMAIRDRRWPDKKLPISRESTGLITALLQLCAVASCQRGGLVTIDELETSLHPHAIRVLIAGFRRWAQEHDLRVVLATQSETVLDQFHDDPGQIYVIEPGQETSPRSLTEMFTPEYLAQFSLGDLFSHLEFGSNGELDPE